ncbi:MAG: tetratricopeptide repeat protein [Pseudomonadota bacterium]|nr:tetratricopeptide repeat protein [Pseudomonadota bacterium]
MTRSFSKPTHRRPAVGPGLRKLLVVVFALFALLVVNSVYLAGVTTLEWATGRVYQDYTYQIVFLLHLVLGLALVLPVAVFGALHFRSAHKRRNRPAVRAGLSLYVTALVLLLSGLVLTRFGFFEINDAGTRRAVYWVHVITPLIVAWLFVLHRLAGPQIRWKSGLRWAGVAAAFSMVMIALDLQDPRDWNARGSESGEQYFLPSLARTASGEFIPAETIMMNDYCAECHQDSHDRWEQSVHHFSSFNNPAYLFSVRETRKVALERDGKLDAARFCAGCHDPVPFFSGAFDDPAFDDENDPIARAGITCTACHAITHINSPRGNADYTIEEPLHYPFAFSENALLKAINHQLIKAKPEFHKKTFLKPLHRTPEFCGTCHKVHLPREVNNYKWLRGQNHYDAFLLSGVSGHGASSFYYPPNAIENCAECHMPLHEARNDFGAHSVAGSTEPVLHDHAFAAANTAVPFMTGLPEEGIAARQAFLSNALRVDIFGLREGGTIQGTLHAPIGPDIPAVTPGSTYLLETVLRTLKPGHVFTQGTSDSNEVWLDVTVYSGERVIGRSGGMGNDGAVDPWSHFVNAYVLDRDGNRIDRRNGQDIFVALYNHQIPPGAADVVHYRLRIPEDVHDTVTVVVELKYRKFDTTYLKYIEGDGFDVNDLPVTIVASDSVTFPVTPAPDSVDETAPATDTWVRWNDYGIGLLRKGNRGSAKGELRQAEQAFAQVEALGRGDGPLNLARVYIKEGRLEDASDALHRAADKGAHPWSVAWFTGLVNKQNGFLDDAIVNFTDVLETNFADARTRGFDFSKDYRVVNELGQTLFERAKQERGDSRRAGRETRLRGAERQFLRTLELDPENVTAHYNLSLILARLGDPAGAAEHRALHLKYKPDDNARERAVALHRRANAAADHAAESVVVYDLQRSGAPGLTPEGRRAASPGTKFEPSG